MSRWDYTLKSGKQLRESINADDSEAVLTALLQCWNEIDHMDKNLPFVDEYIIEIEDTLEYISEGTMVTYSDVDSLLSDLYDYCDIDRIWVDL